MIRWRCAARPANPQARTGGAAGQAIPEQPGAESQYDGESKNGTKQRRCPRWCWLVGSRGSAVDPRDDDTVAAQLSEKGTGGRRRNFPGLGRVRVFSHYVNNCSIGNRFAMHVARQLRLGNMERHHRRDLIK